MHAPSIQTYIHTPVYIHYKRVLALLICLSPFYTKEADNGCHSHNHRLLVQTRANLTDWRRGSSTHLLVPNLPDIPNNFLITPWDFGLRRKGSLVQAPAADKIWKVCWREVHCRGSPWATCKPPPDRTLQMARLSLVFCLRIDMLFPDLQWDGCTRGPRLSLKGCWDKLQPTSSSKRLAHPGYATKACLTLRQK